MTAQQIAQQILDGTQLQDKLIIKLATDLAEMVLADKGEPVLTISRNRDCWHCEGSVSYDEQPEVCPHCNAANPCGDEPIELGEPDAIAHPSRSLSDEEILQKAFNAGFKIDCGIIGE